MIINVIDNEDRLDKYLLDKIEVSRSKLQKMIENGNVLVNGNKVKNSYVVKIDDEITIDENYQEKIAEGIYNGIKSYFNYTEENKDTPEGNNV